MTPTYDHLLEELKHRIVNMEDAARLIGSKFSPRGEGLWDDMHDIADGLRTAARNARKIMEGS